MFVQVPENTVSEENHAYSKHDEARSRAEKRPIFGDVGLEEGQFGENKGILIIVSTDLRA